MVRYEYSYMSTVPACHRYFLFIFKKHITGHSVINQATRVHDVGVCKIYQQIAKMGSRAPAAARVSDVRQMQLWALAPRELTWLARPVFSTSVRRAFGARSVRPANR